MATDIKVGDWVDTHLPPQVRPYARLMRLDRPIGTWLLLLPCWWGVAMAGGGVPDLFYMFLFAVGAIIMRGAGCTINDIFDRDLDAQVERTRTRPLASGEIQLWQAIVFVGCLLVLGLSILFFFNRATIFVGVLSLLLVFSYPQMKRITWWPQLFLGLTFNWGLLVGWMAVRGSIGATVAMMYIAGILWTLAYDTIYAHQDKEDDVLVGIKSTALLFGDQSRLWVGVFYGLSLLFMVLAGSLNDMGMGYFAGLGAAALLVIYHLLAWKMDEPKDCLRRFCANRDVGLIILAAIILGKWV